VESASVDPSTFCERGLLFLIHAQKADSKKIVYDLFVGEFSSILRLRIATPADRYISFDKPSRRPNFAVANKEIYLLHDSIFSPFYNLKKPLYDQELPLSTKA
jgi:hypothetical protein